MPRCYMVKKRTHEDSPSPCSPTEGSVAPLCYEDSHYTETRKAEYAELESLPLSGRTAAETEAAHELLSLAHSLPPLPPLQPMPQPQPQSAPLLPVYTYTIQPTNIYIVTDKPPQPMYPTFQAMTPCPCNYQTEPYFGYISYQQVPPDPVFGPQPQPQPEPASETDSDQEPRLEIASDPDTEPELEIDSDREPDFETEIELETEPFEKHETDPELPNLTSSESEPRSQDYADPQVRLRYDTETASTVLRFAETEPRPVQNFQPATISLHDADLPARSHFYTGPESSCVRYSEPESRLLHYSEAFPMSDPTTKHELRRYEVQVQPCELDKEVLSPPQSWSKKKYDCSDCGKRYATSSNLSRHRQTHRSLDSIMAKRCGECGKVYVSMPALAMHVLTHRMGHVCDTCGKQFSRPWLLRGHLRSHTGEKPYSCESCGKAFADRSNLRAHLQTHASNRKHVCQHCNKTFALKSYLNKHQETACSVPEVK